MRKPIEPEPEPTVEFWIITADDVNPPVWIRDKRHGDALRVTYIRLEAERFPTKDAAEEEMSALGLSFKIWRAVKR